MANDKEELTLPKATVAKLIKEMLPPHIKCTNDTRDLILECCVEFIHLISSEANEICNKENKKTISPDHVLKALTALGFDSYTREVSDVYEKHKLEAQEKPRGTRKLENLGIPQEQLLQGQLLLFAKARAALSNSTESLNTSPSISTATNGPNNSNNSNNANNHTFKTHSSQQHLSQYQQHPPLPQVRQRTSHSQQSLAFPSSVLQMPHQTPQFFPLSASTPSLSTASSPPTIATPTTSTTFSLQTSNPGQLQNISKKRARDNEQNDEYEDDNDEDEGSEGEEEEEIQ